MINPDDVCKKSKNIVSRKIGGEYVLVPIRNEVGDMDNIYRLNDVSAFIWEQIDDEKSINEIVKQITGEFDVTENTARNDTLEFVSTLENKLIFIK